MSPVKEKAVELKRQGGGGGMAIYHNKDYNWNPTCSCCSAVCCFTVWETAERNPMGGLSCPKGYFSSMFCR